MMYLHRKLKEISPAWNNFFANAGSSYIYTALSKKVFLRRVEVFMTDIWANFRNLNMFKDVVVAEVTFLPQDDPMTFRSFAQMAKTAHQWHEAVS